MIVFEGDELVVHYHQGETDYVLVTFQGAHEGSNAAKRFFGSSIVPKLGITCVGVTSKVNHWYFSPDTSLVQKRVLEITQKFSKVIIVGYSMGAHTALAWSKLLNAETVLSLAPKWSIDPDESPVHQHYIANNLRPDMKGMGIRKDQVQGRLFVAYDPLDEPELEQSRIISSKLPEIKILNIYYAEHSIIYSLYGTKLFGDVISALAFGSDQDVYRTVARARRRNENNLNYRLARAVTRHPEMVANTLMSPALMGLPRKQKIFQNEALIGRLLYRVLSRGKEDKACKLFQMATEIALLGKTESKHNDDYTSEYFLIISCHGYVLNYHARDNIFCTRNVVIPGREALEVYAVSVPDGLALMVRINMLEVYLAYHDGKIILTRNVEDENIIRLENFETENGLQNLYHIRSGKNYMCSHPDHRITLNSSTPSDWERFTLLPYALTHRGVESIQNESGAGALLEEQTSEKHPTTVPKAESSFWQKVRQKLNGN
ncbi:hypothetical protein AD940_08360 [Gluconobacter thailandicus]|uniref:hypothetical protein n=1 Tax=Gluconobacter thailandicus TaxID=257438 RepID=UPI0007775BEE|nr:hypothetical protein [Gluconobacter thailandicus]KXV34179.1 hypothetical protein AD940_08360 [Gluconobacter thailandicus]